MLKVEKLNQFYGESHTLWDIDLHVLAGSCTCLMGRNGVGKTTLLKSIMGLSKTSSATITYNGHDISDKPTGVSIPATSTLELDPLNWVLFTLKKH